MREALPLWKRILDLGAIFIFLPGLVLVGSCVALIIRIGSAGPILFKQKRVGHLGKEFVCYKFRTMQVNAETSTHQHYTSQLIESQAPMTKMDANNDARLIPLGAFIRSTGMAELPQFLNILKAEMSLVGPRPCVPYEFEKYKPWHKRRLDAVPGLTGLWQVSGKNRTTFEEMVRLDIRYSRERNLLMDLIIIAKTLPALWTQVMETRAMRKQAAKSTKPQIQNTVTSC
jgi:lipopolysaccharide/colanic/teichoic acid biosynthesis glycosyltransferase